MREDRGVRVVWDCGTRTVSHLEPSTVSRGLRGEWRPNSRGGGTRVGVKFPT